MAKQHIRQQGKRIILFVSLFLLVSASALGLYVNYRMHYDITDVLPGRLYRSSEINPSRLSELAREHDISLVIDLRCPERDDKDEYPQGTTSRMIRESRQALLASGIDHVSVPSSQMPEATTIEAFLNAIQDRTDEAILIHCDHGIGRAGLFTAIYLMEYGGYSNEEARRTVSRYYSFRLHGRKHFRADYNKGKWIIGYNPILRMRRKL